MFIADWHMLTTHYDRTDELPGFTRDIALDLLAAGLDPAKVTFYRQSDFPEVAEMALLLGMVTPLGWLERVPSYKERLRDMTERERRELRPARLPGPADRRHHDRSGQLVPVGEDQVVAPRAVAARSSAGSTACTARCSSSRSRCCRRRR